MFALHGALLRFKLFWEQMDCRALVDIVSFSNYLHVCDLQLLFPENQNSCEVVICTRNFESLFLILLLSSDGR